MFTDNSYSPPPSQRRELKSERLWSSGAPHRRGMSWNCCSRTTRRWYLYPCFRAESSELSIALLGVQNQGIPIVQFWSIFRACASHYTRDGRIQCPTPLGTPFHCAPPTISNHSLLQNPPPQGKGRRGGQSVSRLSRHCSACNRNSGAWVASRGSCIIVHGLRPFISTTGKAPRELATL